MALFAKQAEAKPFEDSGLTLDPNNANRGTKRGLDLLETSVEKYGAGRSVLATADGVVIAGNKASQVAAEKGIPFRVIETDGHELVVVKRSDLPYADPRAKEMAIADNRVGEIDLDWDTETLGLLKDEGVDLGTFFFDEELDKMLGGDGGAGTAPDDEASTDMKCPKCGYEWSKDAPGGTDDFK